jgi:DNA-binding NarL/FixJ family response regulator
VCAAEGAVSQSISIIRDEAANECARGTPAWEVVPSALRAATTPQPFTDRQREIISLAAQGLSNKEIADRLTMSVRSVEGHLFRASQRVGANSREQLIAILHAF